MGSLFAGLRFVGGNQSNVVQNFYLSRALLVVSAKRHDIPVEIVAAGLLDARSNQFRFGAILFRAVGERLAAKIFPVI
jgi:hypothetical protein